MYKHKLFLLTVIAVLGIPFSANSQVTFKDSKPKDINLGSGAIVSKSKMDELRAGIEGLINAPESGAQANFADGQSTSGSTTFFSATAGFASTDATKTIVGTNIPSAATIASVPTTTIAAGSNAAALPQATINVAATTGFATAGKFTVTISGSPVTVTYTGVTGTSFTGCTGGTGTLATAQAVGGQAVLSAAATATGTGINFTILGRTTGVTVDGAKGNAFYTVLTGNRVVTFLHHSPGQVLWWYAKQDGTGSRTVTYSSDVVWPAGTAPTLTTGANKVDIIRCNDTGVGWLCSASGQNF
jgi:hypothetical protein